MKFPCVTILLKIQGGIELSYDFIISVLLESKRISQVLGRASYYNSIKD
jgi:hypothetical protein